MIIINVQKNWVKLIKCINQVYFRNPKTKTPTYQLKNVCNKYINNKITYINNKITIPQIFLVYHHSRRSFNKERT